jgi:glucose-1-phosphate cytidylyltransferase
MKVVILCGGYGTRLTGAGIDLPKPMVPIGGRPIIWHIMRGFSTWGFSDFILCLGYRSDVFKQYFINLATMVGDVSVDPSVKGGLILPQQHEEMEWKITLAETGLDSMTGHRVRRISQYIPMEDDIFAVTYGDGLTNLDFRKVVEFHRAHGKLATVTGVHPPARFGELSIATSGRVAKFNEKPQATGGWISGGYFVFSRDFLNYLSDDPQQMLERDPLQRLAREGELMAYCYDGFWYCMDTPRDYRQLNEMWESGNIPWVVWR